MIQRSIIRKNRLLGAAAITTLGLSACSSPQEQAAFTEASSASNTRTTAASSETSTTTEPSSEPPTTSQPPTEETSEPTTEESSTSAEAPSTGECSTEAMRGHAPMPEPHILDCDGTFAYVGQQSTDWLAVLKFTGAHWDTVQPKGYTDPRQGMERPCYSPEQLADAPSFITSRVATC